MSILKSVFGGRKKIEKLIVALTYVSPKMLSLREERSKNDYELVMAYATSHDIPADIMFKEHALTHAMIKVEETDEKIRVKAAQELGDMKALEAVPALIGALEANYPPVRLSAAIALGKIGDQRATAELETIVSDEHMEQELRQAAQQALLMLRSSEVG